MSEPCPNCHQTDTIFSHSKHETGQPFDEYHCNNLNCRVLVFAVGDEP